MYKFTLFRVEARLLFQARGFWDVSIAQSMHDELDRIMRVAASLDRPLRVLGDLTDFDVQDQQVSLAMESSADLMRRSAVDRHAIVQTSALKRMQGRRMMSAGGVEIFTSMREAAQWLEWPMEDLSAALWSGQRDGASRAVS